LRSKKRPYAGYSWITAAGAQTPSFSHSEIWELPALPLKMLCFSRNGVTFLQPWPFPFPLPLRLRAVLTLSCRDLIFNLSYSRPPPQFRKLSHVMFSAPPFFLSRLFRLPFPLQVSAEDFPYFFPYFPAVLIPFFFDRALRSPPSPPVQEIPPPFLENMSVPRPRPFAILSPPPRALTNFYQVRSLLSVTFPSFPDLFRLFDPTTSRNLKTLKI